MSSSHYTNKEISLVMVGGPSGVGKTTIINALIEKYPKAYRRPKSYTTRRPRPGEERTLGEYSFVSPQQMDRLHEAGDLVALDHAYGNAYAIDRASLEAIADGGHIPIKEVHPANHAKLRQHLPRALSVLLRQIKTPAGTIEDFRGIAPDRADRDQAYFSSLEISAFDVVYPMTNLKISVDVCALHRTLSAVLQLRDRYPGAAEIDELNRAGYEKLANEFHDSFRVTTKNFHEVSRAFWQDVIKRLIKRDADCLELGPGNGWLRSAVNWPNVKYHSIDIASSMSRDKRDVHDCTTTARCLPYDAETFDAVVASLADPFLFPAAVSEISRVLRPHGRFIFTAPTASWAKAVRDSKLLDVTTFVMSAGEHITVFSFAREDSEIAELAGLTGFTIESHSLLKGSHLPRLGTVSPILAKAADQLECPLAELPILDAFVLSKVSEDNG